MRVRTTRRWLVAPALMALLGSVPGIAGAASRPTPTAAVQMTKGDPVPFRAFSSPYMLADPANPRVIVAAVAELRTGVCYLARSTDAGRDWTILPAVPGLSAYPSCTGGVGGVVMGALAWGRDHTLYYALNGYGKGDGGNSRGADYSVLLARSTNLGNSWSTTIVDNSRGLTGTEVTYNAPVTSVAVDTSKSRDIVYVGWGQSHPAAPKGSPLANSGTMVAVSTDGGSTFAKPVDVNQFSHVNLSAGDQSYPLIMSAPFLAVGRGGVLEAMSGPRTLASAKLSGPTPAEPVLGARSTDQGRTWTVSALSPPMSTPRGPVLEAALRWIPLGGPQGTFVTAYAAWPEASAGPAQIEFQRSTDGGQTWAAPAALNNDDPSQQFLHFLPEMGVAPNGRIDVAWYDFRGQSGFAPDVYATSSSDGGATWTPNVKVTDRPIDFSIGVSAYSDVRQPPGVASANQYTAFGWADTRLGNPQTQTQDVFANVVQYSPLPASGSTVLPVLAAVCAGLVLAGAVLFLVLALRRRRESAPGRRLRPGEPAVSV